MPRFSPDLRDQLLRAGVAPNVVDALQSGSDLSSGERARLIAAGLATPLDMPARREDPLRDQVDYLVASLVQKLREQPGIPVREPPQVAPTFFATPFSWCFTVDIVAGGNTVVAGAHWSPRKDDAVSGSTQLIGNSSMDLTRDPEPWPAGSVGFLTFAEVSVGQISTLPIPIVTHPARMARWSLKKNDAYVHGFQNTLPSVTAGTFGPFLHTLAYLNYRNVLPCFVPLRAGDRIVVELDSLVPPLEARLAFVAVLQGYKVPLPMGDGHTPEQFKFD